MQKQNILIVLTSHDQYNHSSDKTGYWLEEVSHFWHGVTEAGFKVELVSPRGGTPPQDERSGKASDPMNQAFLATMGEELRHTRTPDEVKAADYGAIYFVGGHGAMWDFPSHPRLNALAVEI